MRPVSQVVRSSRVSGRRLAPLDDENVEESQVDSRPGSRVIALSRSLSRSATIEPPLTRRYDPGPPEGRREAITVTISACNLLMHVHQKVARLRASRRRLLRPGLSICLRR